MLGFSVFLQGRVPTIFGDQTRSDGAEMTISDTIACGCVTRADNRGVRYTGPDRLLDTGVASRRMNSIGSRTMRVLPLCHAVLTLCNTCARWSMLSRSKLIAGVKCNVTRQLKTLTPDGKQPTGT